MDLSSISPQAVLAAKNAQTGIEFSMLATRRAIDTMQAEGQLVMQLVEQVAGVGQNINASV
ncbi:MAG: hypothetical protein FWG02_05310 [Holophagaceae bacterium]|nr:hypothetical protein [Holophagaceae bacterium]